MNSNFQGFFTNKNAKFNFFYFHFHLIYCVIFSQSVCKIPNTLVTTTPKPTSPPQLECEKGWAKSNGKCFKLFAPEQKSRLNWYQAESYCSKVGLGTGHLSSFSSMDQLNEITRNQSLIFFTSSDPGFWIGLNRLDKEREDFQWSDSSDSTFRNWLDLII